MPYEVDINRGASGGRRNRTGLATNANSTGREGYAAHYKFYELEPAIVIEVNLTDKNSSKIGECIVRPIYSYSNVPIENLPIAKPLDSNVKNYPIVGEVVIVVEYGGIMYYTQRLNLFNLVNNNIINAPKPPSSEETTTSEDYQATSFGNFNVEGANETDDRQTYFEPKTIIKSLLPLEGDIIYEGRFGQSVRFGGTVTEGTQNLDSRFDNSWVFGKELGSPIIIIRCGQKSGLKKDTQPYVEDINKDPSSLYLTSGQLIPINPPGKNLKSYKGDFPSKYEGNQAILSSDRIILDARKEELLLFSPKTISLSTLKTVHIDAPTHTIINSQKIYLGLDATEHLVLGDKASDWLKELVGQIQDLIDAIQRSWVKTGSGPSGTIEETSKPNYTPIINKLKQLENKLPTLLSKQNTTL